MADLILNFFSIAIVLIYLRMVMRIDPASFKLVIFFAILLGVLAVCMSFLYNWANLRAATQLVAMPEDKRFKSPGEWLELDNHLARYPSKTSFSTFITWSAGAVLAGAALHYWKDYLSSREMIYLIIGGVLMGGICGGYNFFFFKLHLAPIRFQLAPAFPPPDWKPIGSIRRILLTAFFSISMALIFFPTAVLYVRMHELQREGIRQDGQGWLNLLNEELAGQGIISNENLTPSALRFLEEVTPGKHGFTLLFDRKGRTFFGSHTELSDSVWGKMQSEESGMINEPEKGLEIIFGPVGSSSLKAAVVYSRADFRTDNLNLIRFTIVVIGLSLFMAVGLIVLVRRYFGSAVEGLVEDIHAISVGEFGRKIPICSDGEFGSLEYRLASMKNKLVHLIEAQRALVYRVGANVEQLGKSAMELREVSSEQASSSIQQAGSAQQAGTTSEEIKATSGQIAERAAAVSEMASETFNAAGKGAIAATQALTVIRNVEHRVALIAEKMLLLGDNIQSISNIADTIKGISQKTRLLAVNAGIEARGAGEAAQRFQVVADEIQNLSQSTAKSVEEVREQLEKIRGSMEEAISSTEEGEKAAGGGVKKVESVANTFTQMENTFAKTNQQAHEIAISIKHQTTAAEQMAQTIAELHESAVQVANGAKRIETAIGELDSLAEELKQMVFART